jgi:hypothetical protein
MLPFIFGIILGSREIPKPVRIVIVVLAVGLVLAVTVYTINLVLTLPERTTCHHAHPHSTR